MAARWQFKTGDVRIIGGKWRRRKLSFPEVEGLRPTPDRVRETLFSWLGPHLDDAYCLDLFAGSGALGIEALSRGAAHCDFVERDGTAANAIEGHLQALDCDRSAVWWTDGLAWLRWAGAAAPSGQLAPQLQQIGAAPWPGGGIYDIVFLDPPFDRGLTAPACTVLERSGLLAPGARIYVETSSKDAPPAVPDSWKMKKEKKAGDVTFRLFSNDA